uniref:Zinc finger E-box-binding homeobox 2-like n=1 Tax=Geotrypetes seraphini TaxID=260995 RepID=A0A6P8Q051_GEOSA|nr:zinc finger E-box-binding homeobox 2-like [Geotrypetes seraphini]
MCMRERERNSEREETGFQPRSSNAESLSACCQLKPCASIPYSCSHHRMEEEPRGTRRKQAKPRRNHGLHGKAPEHGENGEAPKPSVMEENRVNEATDVTSWLPPTTGTTRQPSLPPAYMDWVSAEHMWRIQINADRQQSENGGNILKGRLAPEEGVEDEEEEEKRSPEQFMDYIPPNSTTVIYPEVPDEGNQCRSPEPMALQDGFACLLRCPYCERGYRCQASLNNHVWHNHGRQETFVCSLCGCMVHCKSHLEQHMTTHAAPGSVSAHNQHVGDQSTEDRKFKCSECGKAFKYKHHLKEHLRIHSGEKPYECPKCKKRFSHSGSYSSHLSNKKCLPPETATNKMTDEPRKSSSPVSTSCSASPAHSSISPHSSQDTGHQQTNGLLIQDYKTRNGSLHCSDAIKNFAWLGVHVSVLQNTMQGLPIDLEPQPVYSLPGENPVHLLQHISHRRGKKSYCDSTSNLKTGKENGLGACAETGLWKASSFEMGHGCQAGGDPAEATVYLRNPKFCAKGNKVSFGGLQSHGKHTSPEDNYTGEQEIPLSIQTTENNFQVESGRMTPICAKRTTLSSLQRVGKNCMNNREVDWRQCSLPRVYEKRKLYDLGLDLASTRTLKSFPEITEPQMVEDTQNTSTNSTAVASQVHHNHFLPAFNLPRSSINGLHCTPKISASKETQAEPLDLSLPKSEKEAHASLSVKDRANSAAQIQAMEDKLFHMDNNKSHNQSTKMMLKYNSLYPDSPYSTLCGFLPSALNNLLQERCPVLQMNPELQDLQFLPCMTYLYRAESAHMSCKLQEKQVLLEELFNRGETELPVLPDEGMEGESTLVRKRLRRTEEGLYACDLCDKTFHKSSSLLRHKYEHTGKRPHQCKTCQKAFKHKHHLIEHLRLHSGEKPYQCKKCGKRFSHSGSYSQHMNHRYAYCRKESKSLLEEGNGALTNMEECPELTSSPGNQSGESEHELDHMGNQSGESQLGRQSELDNHNEQTEDCQFNNQSGSRQPKLSFLGDQSEDPQTKLNFPDNQLGCNQLKDQSGD